MPPGKLRSNDSFFFGVDGLLSFSTPQNSHRFPPHLTGSDLLYDTSRRRRPRLESFTVTASRREKGLTPVVRRDATDGQASLHVRTRERHRRADSQTPRLATERATGTPALRQSLGLRHNSSNIIGKATPSLD